MAEKMNADDREAGSATLGAEEAFERGARVCGRRSGGSRLRDRRCSPGRRRRRSSRRPTRELRMVTVCGGECDDLRSVSGRLASRWTLDWSGLPITAKLRLHRRRSADVVLRRTLPVLQRRWSTRPFELIEVKAGRRTGTFTALASVFGNVDSVGDRMLPGSFSKTLERWRESGDPIPVIFSHDWDDPIGSSARPTPTRSSRPSTGLMVHGQLDLENPTAKQVHQLMKDRLINGWSLRLHRPQGRAEAQERRQRGLRGRPDRGRPDPAGANAEAQLQAVKSRRACDGDRGGAAEAVIPTSTRCTAPRRSC